jgi:chorismate synthase
MLRFLTAGESHGEALTVILEGLPAGLAIDVAGIDHELRRRQGGYGRGQRMTIERDRAEVLAGVRGGETIGSPIAVLLRNLDWKNWQRTMHVGREPAEGAAGSRRPPLTRPRPGHADLAGALKYDRRDLRDVLERASARETAARVAAGAFARQLLSACGMALGSHVTRIGDIALDEARLVTFEDVRALPDDSALRCVDPDRERLMIDAIDRAKAEGDTLGGSFEVIVTGVPPGLGSHVQWDRKLDGRLAQALMSIPAIKAVGIGLGAGVAARPGSLVHDEIVPGDEAARGGLAPALARPSNRAGGLEGGITNGEDVRVTACMKPIATLMKPLRSVDLDTLAASPATIERSDVCAVPAAAVVGEAMAALVMAGAVLEKFGGDSMTELLGNLAAARDRLRARLAPRAGRHAEGA